MILGYPDYVDKVVSILRDITRFIKLGPIDTLNQTVSSGGIV